MKCLVSILVFSFFIIESCTASFLQLHSRNKRQIGKIRFSSIIKNKQIISWWSKRSLTWALANQPLTLDWNETMNAFEKAFSFWSEVSQLKFKPICREHGCEIINNVIPDITIQFLTSSQHNSFCKFHFSHTTLAHGFYPEKGIAHFNIERNWTLKNLDSIDMKSLTRSQYPYNLIAVATHEIGHLLGLDHSNNVESIMFSQYKSALNDIVFHQSDISMIQSIYGKPYNKEVRMPNRFKYMNSITNSN